MCIRDRAKTTALAIYIDDNNRIDYPDGTVVNGTILATTDVYKRQMQVLI